MNSSRTAKEKMMLERRHEKDFNFWDHVLAHSWDLY